ncbi:uncharacterized protein LOC108052413 [Drosophila rhopaloa]|uniref:Serine protease gd N-terminal domain-containing protein n=1 Tax=Drosophila rhopaloa TaxID=1041015 RepID=A0ABM5I582_DRORH|nr:uncharacterized protein LOC108052413 [Drosophila rhopaloa]
MSISNFIFVGFFLGTTVALIFPQHNCPEYFTYGIEENESYIGVFTAKEPANIKLNFSVMFAWQGSAMIIPMELYPNNKEAAKNIKLGKRAQIYFRFDEVSEMLPVPHMFIFNDELLCNTELNATSYNLYPVDVIIPRFENIQQVRNTLPKMHPIFPRIQPVINIE